MASEQQLKANADLTNRIFEAILPVVAGESYTDVVASLAQITMFTVKTIGDLNPNSKGISAEFFEALERFMGTMAKIYRKDSKR